MQVGPMDNGVGDEEISGVSMEEEEDVVVAKEVG